MKHLSTPPNYLRQPFALKFTLLTSVTFYEGDLANLLFLPLAA